MANEFALFQQAVREANQIASVALQCAVFVLRRAQELPEGQRKEMFEVLKALISEDEEKAMRIPSRPLPLSETR